jgi:hypothetical protein
VPRLLVAALAALALLVVASAAHAAVTIGSNLTGSGADNLQQYCTATGTCTSTNLNLPAGSVAANGLTSPINGVVVLWRVKTGSTPGAPVALRVLRQGFGTNYTAKSTSAAQTLGAGSVDAQGVATFPTRLSIAAGDSVGLNIGGNSPLVFANTPGASAVLWGSVNSFPNGLADGATAPGNAESGKELLVQAVVEPDADNDGFGDETQDQCPGDPTRQTLPCSTGPTNPGANPPPPGVGPTDTTRPVVTALLVAPNTFRAGTLLPRLSAVIPTGTRISWRLSEAAQTTLLFEQTRPGRRRGARCVLQTRLVNTGTRCTVYTRRGTMTGLAGKQGLNRLRFQGRLSATRRLPIGRYRLTVTARDAAGNTSLLKRTTFRMLPRLRR